MSSSTLVVGNRQDVLERVVGHTADVAITGKPPGDARLVAEPFMKNEIVCITAPDDPAAGAGPAGPGGSRIGAGCSGSRAPALGRSTSSSWPSTISSRRRSRSGSNGAIKQAARAGLGISLLSRAAVEAELESGWLGEIALTDGPEARPWFLLRSALGPVRPTVELFTGYVLAQDRRREPDGRRGRARRPGRSRRAR